jgi:threonine/homoserine/homoserine lactone efflux protein
MTDALVCGFLLGLSCGLSPGPLMTLVLSQSLRHGAGEGCRVALAPLITDAPMILLALGLTTQLAGFRGILGGISLAGAVFVFYLAWENFRARPIEVAEQVAEPCSWRKGILANLLNPSPWLFWLTVGAATLSKTLAHTWLTATAFLALFYLALVGSKIALAVVAARCRPWLSGKACAWILRSLGAALAGFGILLVRDSLRYWGLT